MDNKRLGGILERVGAGVSMFNNDAQVRQSGYNRIGDIRAREDAQMQAEAEAEKEARGVQQKIKLSMFQKHVETLQRPDLTEEQKAPVLKNAQLIAEDLGLPEEVVAGYLNMPSAQPTFQSKVGREFSDRSALVRQFGEGSPEVQQFDKTAAGTQKQTTGEFERLNAIPEAERSPEVKARLAKLTAPAAGITIHNIPPGNVPATTTTLNDLQKKVMEADAGISQLETNLANFDAQFATVGGKLKAGGIALGEKLGIKQSGPNKEYLDRFETFRSGALNTINEYIKNITGAAMSNAEADRIRKGMPDPGEKIFDGDSATQYKAKLERVMKELRIKRRKAMYQMRNGFEPIDSAGNETMSNAQFSQQMDQRGMELERQFMEQGMPKADAEAAALRQVRKEFMGAE